MNEQSIQLDRMRFTKNTTSSRLAIIAIVFDVLYFVSIYKTNVDFYYNILMGASILYNLVFMLAAFLSSEGVKNYKQGFSFVLCALGIIQVARIFILPVKAHATTVTVAGTQLLAMGNGQFIRVVIYLVASAVCLFWAAVVNMQKSRALQAHIATLEAQKA
ncbi:MAG: hypothetical protein ACSW8J_00575 [bacterium]